MPPTTPDPVYRLRGCGQPITALDILDQSYLIVGTQSGDVCVWDLDSRRMLDRKSPSEDLILGVRCLQRNVAVSQGRNGIIRKWQWEHERLKEIDSIPYETVGFFSLCLSPTANQFIITSSQSSGQLVVMSTDGSQHGNLVVKEVTERKYGMAMVARYLNSRIIFVGYEDGSVAAWSAESFLILGRLPVHKETVLTLDVTEKSTRGISGSPEKELKIWTWDANFNISILETIEITNPGVNCIEIRKDEKIMACGCWDGSVRVFSMKTFKPLAVLKAHKAPVRCIKFSEENFLFVGAEDEMISVWDVYK